MTAGWVAEAAAPAIKRRFGTIDVMAKSTGSLLEKDIDRFLAAWFGLRQVIQAANFNQFSRAGLSATQFMTLNLLPPEEDSISMGELAGRMNLKPATIAKTVDSLEARNFICRTKSSLDGRLVLVKITKQGRRFQNSAAGQFRKHIRELFLGVSPKHRSGLIVGLERLVDAADAAGSIAVLKTTPRANDAPPEKRSSARVPRR